MAMYDVVIIGAGPAGLSASIYTSRAGLKTLVIGNTLQSKIAIKHKLENYFGFEAGIEGAALLEKGARQAKKFGAELVRDEAVDIKRKKEGFETRDSKNNRYESRAVIMAMGSNTEKLGIKNEKELTSRGVHYCAICDGPIYNNRKIVVVGSGNHAAEEALELSAYSKDVTIISHKNKFNISKEFLKQIKDKKIKLVEQEILEFVGKNKLEGIKLGDENMKCDAAFIAAGMASSSSLAGKLGLEIRGSSIVVNENNETSVKGIYAAGESTGENKQVAICAGEGCNAGVNAIRHLRKIERYNDYR